jgi:D-sedoheptulose 7-phosphate isomerase
VTYFTNTIEALRALDPTPLLARIRAAHERGGTIWLCGNGGSASTVQHWACDLGKAAEVRAVALGSNPAVLTAWANDVAYDEALARELSTLGRPDDLLIALSCSGTSLNVGSALVTASLMGMPTALLTSQLCQAAPADLIIRVASDEYGVIEDCHLAIGHWLTRELRR